MNKKFLPLIFLLIGLACSNSVEDPLVPDEQDEPEKKEITEREEVIAEMVTNGKYSFLGVSYDITSEYLDVSATKRLVVNVEEYLEQTGYFSSFIIDPTSRGYTSLYSGYNALHFLENLTSKADVDAKLGHINTGSESALDYILSSKNLKIPDDANEEDIYAANYSYARADRIGVIKRVELNARPEMLQSYVYQEFLDDLNEYAPDEFVKMYGTHVLLNVSIGDRIQFNYRSKLAAEYGQWEKIRIVEAGALVAVNQFVSPGIYGSETGENAAKNTEWDTTVRYRKDANTYISVFFGSDTKLPTTAFDGWGSFLNEDNAVIVEIDWRNTYPISDFIADPEKRAEIEDAIKRYVAL